MSLSLLMADGEYAWLSNSGKYYIRRFRLTPKLKKEVPEEDNWQGIAYYGLHDKQRIPLAEGECKICGDIVRSLHCGDYVSCKCGESAVDTDRWYPERHRYIGNIRSLA